MSKNEIIQVYVLYCPSSWAKAYTLCNCVWHERTHSIAGLSKPEGQGGKCSPPPPPEFGLRKSLTCSIKWPYLSSFPYFDWNRSKTCPIRWPSFPSHIFRLSYGPELHWQKSDEAQQDVLFPHIWSITILLLDIISWKSLFPQSFVYFMIPLLDIKTGRFLVFKHMSLYCIHYILTFLKILTMKTHLL